MKQFQAFSVCSAISRCLGMLCILAAAVAPAFPVHASVGTNHYISPNGTNAGDCTTPAAPCKTVTYALSQSAAGDTLLLDAGTYTENLTIDKALNILKNPDTRGEVIIDGGHAGRVIHVKYYQVTLQGLIIQNGQITDAPGAGIYNEYGNLSIDDSIIRNNTILFSDPNGSSNYFFSGGGIFNHTGTLIIRNSSVHHNSSYDGGGLNSTGSLTVDGTEIFANTARRYGGGVWIPYGSVSVIENSTISGNTASYMDGVGISDSGVAADLIYDHIFRNVTISGNGISSVGGLYSTVQVELDHCTVTDNSGYNLYLTEKQANFGYQNPHSLVKSSIISASSSPDKVCSIYEPASFDLSGGHNLSSDISCGFDQPSDQENTAPALLSLADNGGPVQTHALSEGSPAIDHADIYFSGFDARGVSPKDGDGDSIVTADIGAYEYEPPHFVVFLPMTLK